jgi:hypothetical protein
LQERTASGFGVTEGASLQRALDGALRSVVAGSSRRALPD